MPLQKLDHLVMPTADLAAARARLSALGFTVAPDGRHPFGTANCCVYFADGTFIEPLAVDDGAAVAEAIRGGNVFAARDHVFRAMRADEGLSVIVLASDDSEADHARFAATDRSGGEMLTFSRPFVDAQGRSDTATFRLAFAADPDTPDAFLFSCQRLGAPAVDREALERHANGTTAIREIVLSPDAGSYLDLVASACGEDRREGGVRLAKAMVRAARADDPPEWSTGNTLAAIVLAVADLERTREVVAASGIGHIPGNAAILVPAAPGQGVPFMFREDA